MMKRLILFLMCLISFYSYGQKTNKWGQKMIKSVTQKMIAKDHVEYTDGTSEDRVGVYINVIYCKYDKDNNLSEITFKDKWYIENSEIGEDWDIYKFSKKNPVTYNGGIYKKQTYTFDNDGYITELLDTSPFKKSGYYGGKYNITYQEFDNGIKKPLAFSYTNLEKSSSNSKIIYGSTCTNKCKYYKGIVVPSDFTVEQCEERCKLYDFDKPNDINLNVINGFVLPECGGGIQLIDITEWVNMRSDFLLKENTRYNNQYKYDSNNNIVEVTWHWTNPNRDYKLNIEYVY